MTLSAESKEFIKGIKLPHYVNSRSVATISGYAVTATQALIANTLAGNNTLLSGSPGSGKTQFLWDVINAVAGENNALEIREELHRGDIKGIFRYLDRQVYESTGRSDAAVKAKNLDKVLFGIEEITRSGPLQNSLFAIVDGEIYDDSNGTFYRLGQTLTGNQRFHVCVATGNFPNGDADFLSPLSEALATRFHLTIDTGDWSKTVADDTTVYLQQRGPRVTFTEAQEAQEQHNRLALLLKTHQEITALHQPDILEDAVMKYFTLGLDYCQTQKGGEFALVPNSKRGMQHAWPSTCATCPLINELQYACGAVRPAETRHVNAWLRLRNALEAIAESNGANVQPTHSLSNLLEAIKISAPYTMQWNPRIIQSDTCMRNPANAARGMIKTFKEVYNILEADIKSEALLAAQGKLYDEKERENLNLTSAKKSEQLLSSLDTTPVLKQLGYLREMLDDYNKRAINGTLP